MNLHNLKSFFLNELPAHEIVNEIAMEVEAYRVARQKRGARCSVYVTNEDSEFEIKAVHLKHLLDGYLAGELNEWHLEYICDVLEFSDEGFSLETDELREIIFQLANPDINSPISKGLVEQLRNELS